MKSDKKIIAFPKKLQMNGKSIGANKNNRFLIWYALVLFSLATVLVLLSYALQAAGDKERTAALGEAAQERQVAVTALERMEQLQQDNEELRQLIDRLEEQIERMQEENELLESSLASMTTRREEETAVYETQLKQLQEEAARLREEMALWQSEKE